MQNEPNFGKAQMNVNKVLTKDYENKCGKDLWKNEPKTNPIKPNFKRAKMNVKSFITKDYRKKDDFAIRKNEPNSKPIGEDQYKTKDPRHKTKDTSLESEVWGLKSGRKGKIDA
jgi:hypothetical protein